MNHEPSTVPQAEVTIRPSQSRHNRIWILEVVKCPYCEKVHFTEAVRLLSPHFWGIAWHIASPDSLRWVSKN